MTAVLEKPVFKTWKTIKLGTGLKTVSDFRRAMRMLRMKIRPHAEDILEKSAFTVAECMTEVELVVVTVAELGFKDGATREEIYFRAQELGLDLCPPEVGPQLRLQYTDQPKRAWLLIAMEPITGSDGYLYMFCVENIKGARWLLAGFGYPGSVWDAYHLFVFLRRK